jgi:hypothetical protein
MPFAHSFQENTLEASVVDQNLLAGSLPLEQDLYPLKIGSSVTSLQSGPRGFEIDI